VKLRLLLVIFLTLSAIGYASGPQAYKPKIQLEHPVNPHLDIPKNCQQQELPGGTVLLTCECEACAQATADDLAGDLREPDQWKCASKDGALYCDYNLDTVTVPERRHSRI